MPKGRKKVITTDGTLRLENELENASPYEFIKALSTHEPLSQERLQVRVSAEEKKSIDRVRGEYGLSVTQYFTRLHRMACERLGGTSRLKSSEVDLLPNREQEEAELRKVVATDFISEVDGQPHQITRLDVIGHSWRRLAVKMLKVLDRDAYEEYKRLKYPPGVDNPYHETREKAYEFVVKRFLELSYGTPGF